MNKVIMMGRITRDPEVKYTQGTTPTAISKFSLAVDRKFKRDGEPEADFFNCTAFGKQAEFAEKYLKQGTKIVVVGRLQNDNYTNKEGQKVYSTQIMIDEMEFAESKGSGNESSARQQISKQTPTQATGIGSMNIPTDLDETELPFN